MILVKVNLVKVNLVIKLRAHLRPESLPVDRSSFTDMLHVAGDQPPNPASDTAHNIAMKRITSLVGMREKQNCSWTISTAVLCTRTFAELLWLRILVAQDMASLTPPSGTHAQTCLSDGVSDTPVACHSQCIRACVDSLSEPSAGCMWIVTNIDCCCEAFAFRIHTRRSVQAH